MFMWVLCGLCMCVRERMHVHEFMNANVLQWYTCELANKNDSVTTMILSLLSDLNLYITVSNV